MLSANIIIFARNDKGVRLIARIKTFIMSQMILVYLTLNTLSDV